MIEIYRLIRRLYYRGIIIFLYQVEYKRAMLKSSAGKKCNCKSDKHFFYWSNFRIFDCSIFSIFWCIFLKKLCIISTKFLLIFCLFTCSFTKSKKEFFFHLSMFKEYTQQTFNCSKSRIESLEKGVKRVQIYPIRYISHCNCISLSDCKCKKRKWLSLL